MTLFSTLGTNWLYFAAILPVAIILGLETTQGSRDKCVYFDVQESNDAGRMEQCNVTKYMLTKSQLPKKQTNTRNTSMRPCLRTTSPYYDYANKFQITDVGEDEGIKVKTDTSLQEAVMGCAGSKSVAIAPGKQLYLYMSEEEIKLVQESWEVLKDDLEEVGFLVFQRLLCMHDEVKKLFHMFLTQESSGEYVIDEGKLRTHSRIVMEALGAAVECLDDSDQLTLILISAGQRHANYDVQSNMVLHMWPAVKGALADKLGGGLTNELKRAWEHVFDYIASKFAEGVVVCNKDSINTRHIV